MGYLHLLKIIISENNYIYACRIMFLIKIALVYSFTENAYSVKEYNCAVDNSGLSSWIQVFKQKF